MIIRVRRPSVASLLLASALTLVTVVAACGSSGSGHGAPGGDDGGLTDGTTGSDGKGFGDGNGSSGGSSGGGGDGSFTDASFPCDGCTPFPPQGAPTCAPSVLGPPTLVYPTDGMLLPPNMNVLEVQWVPPAGAALFEVDFTNAATQVTVETPCNGITSVRGVANLGCGLTLSQTEWNDIANANRGGDPLKITVRATPAGGACVTASPQSVAISFAEQDLTGGIYYWQSAPSNGTVQAGKAGGIYYHDFGTFDPTPTPFWTAGATGRCIGCHTLSKDGVRMALMNDDADADDEYGDVTTLTMDVGSRTVLGGKNVGPGFQTFTHDHALMIASTFKPGAGPGGGNPDSTFGVWNGDGTTLLGTDALPANMQGTQPNLSWDDKTLVFVAPTFKSISMAGDHHFLGGALWSAAFDTTGHGLTGFAALLTPTATQSFYYPDQSVDGNWIVLNENDDTSAANNDGDCFYSRRARVELLHFPPQAGDVPLDLGALNVADGLSNSWPRWSPAVQTYKGHHILWVTFSSNRDYGLHLKNTVTGYPQGSPLDAGNASMSYDNYYPPESPAYDQPQPGSKQGVTFGDYAAPQIWMAAVVVDPDRTLDAKDRSMPAFWLPFQDVTAHNHSAQWVTQVQSAPPGGDGGTSDGGSSSGGGDGGGSCGEQGGACGTGGGTCCADVVCCPGSASTCQFTCVQ